MIVRHAVQTSRQMLARPTSLLNAFGQVALYVFLLHHFAAGSEHGLGFAILALWLPPFMLSTSVEETWRSEPRTLPLTPRDRVFGTLLAFAVLWSLAAAPWIVWTAFHGGSVARATACAVLLPLVGLAPMTTLRVRPQIGGAVGGLSGVRRFQWTLLAPLGVLWIDDPVTQLGVLVVAGFVLSPWLVKAPARRVNPLRPIVQAVSAAFAPITRRMPDLSSKEDESLVLRVSRYGGNLLILVLCMAAARTAITWWPGPAFGLKSGGMELLQIVGISVMFAAATFAPSALGPWPRTGGIAPVLHLPVSIRIYLADAWFSGLVAALACAACLAEWWALGMGPMDARMVVTAMVAACLIRAGFGVSVILTALPTRSPRAASLWSLAGGVLLFKLISPSNGLLAVGVSVALLVYVTLAAVVVGSMTLHAWRGTGG